MYYQYLPPTPSARLHGWNSSLLPAHDLPSGSHASSLSTSDLPRLADYLSVYVTLSFRSPYHHPRLPSPAPNPTWQPMLSLPRRRYHPSHFINSSNAFTISAHKYFLRPVRRGYPASISRRRPTKIPSAHRYHISMDLATSLASPLQGFFRSVMCIECAPRRISGCLMARAKSILCV